MDLEIIEYLKTNVSPEMAETYEKSFELLNRYNVEDYIIPFHQIFVLVDDFDTTYILEQFNQEIMTTLISVVNQHGVFLTDDADQSFINNLLDSILNVDDYEDVNGVLDIIHSQINDEEKVANILNLIGTLEVEEIMSNVERVNPGLLRMIDSLFSVREQIKNVEQQDTTTIIRAKAQWVKKLYSLTTSEFKDCKITVFYTQLENGLRFNLDFKFYIDLLWEEITVLNNAEIARELIGMAIVSNDQSDRALEAIKEYVGQHFSDLDQIGRVTDLVTRQFLVSKQDNGINLES